MKFQLGRNTCARKQAHFSARKSEPRALETRRVFMPRFWPVFGAGNPHLAIGKPIYGLEITTGNWAGNPARISTRWCQKAGLKTSPLSMAPESRSAPNHAAAGSTSCIRCAPKRPSQWRRRRVPFLRHPTPPSHGGRMSWKLSRTRSPAPPPTTTAQKAHTHVPRTQTYENKQTKKQTN